MNQIFEPYPATKKYFIENDLWIRPSIEEDLKPMIDMMLKIYDELAPRLASWYRKHLDAFEKEFYGHKKQDPVKRVFYTIEDENLIIGSGGIIQKDPVKEPDIAELVDVYLFKEYREKGLGKMLVEDLIKKSSEIGFEKIYLTSRVEFEQAIGLYKRLGFIEIPNTRYESQSSLAFELKLA